MLNRSIVPPKMAAVKCCGQFLPFARLADAKATKVLAYATLQMVANDDAATIEVASAQYTEASVLVAQAEIAFVLSQAKPNHAVVSLSQFAVPRDVQTYETTDAAGDPVVVAVNGGMR